MSKGNYLPLMKEGPLLYQGTWLLDTYQEVLEVLSIFNSFEEGKKKKDQTDVITHGECHTSSQAVPLRSFTPSKNSQSK